MAKRKNIGKAVRFEVLKRDSFTCQYCGRKAPDIFLVIDHIEPVSKGGTSDLFNLITSCDDCNSGKSDRRLSDSSVLEKQRLQLEKLQERKEQIEMMFQWQKGLSQLDDNLLKSLADHWSEVVPGYSLNETGFQELKRLNRKFEIDEILAAMKISTDQYLTFQNGQPTPSSVEVAWQKVGGICTVRREQLQRPHMKRLRYIRGILRNRLSYLNEFRSLELLEAAFEANASLDSLEEHAKSVRNWSEWRSALETFLQSPENSIEIPEIKPQ